MSDTERQEPESCPEGAAGSRGDSLPSSWWNGSFSGFSSRDFSTPWVGGRKVGLTGRGLAIFSIFLEGHLKSQAGEDEVGVPRRKNTREQTHESIQSGKCKDPTPAFEDYAAERSAAV